MGDSAQDLVERTLSATGDQQVALSSVGLTELVHGIYRAHSPTARRRRQVFIEDLVAGLTVYPYTADTALLAGKIDGEQTARGVIIPFADLMIGVTALSIEFAMLTVNERHFRLIPGLQVIQL